MTEESTQYVMAYRVHEGCILKTENSTIETNGIELTFHSSKQYSNNDYFELCISEDEGDLEYKMQCVDVKTKKTEGSKIEHGNKKNIWLYEHTHTFTQYNDVDDEEYSAGDFNKITMKITEDFKKYDNTQIISIGLKHAGKQQTLDEYDENKVIKDLVKTIKDSDVKVDLIEEQ
jgi:hypothetical protein